MGHDFSVLKRGNVTPHPEKLRFSDLSRERERFIALHLIH
jgi:hypothetical protein